MRLSKSKILSYRQCPKRLWLEVNRPELIESSTGAQAVIERGHQVGEIARDLYGPGELMFDQESRDYTRALRQTKALVTAAGKRTLFEAAFAHDNVFVMADVLRVQRGGADVVEVKSSGSVKDYHVEDCATQVHVIERSGLKVRSVRVAHVDSAFVYKKAGDYRGLLAEADISDGVRALREVVPTWIKGATRTLAGDEPDVQPGAHCNSPFECPFYQHCNPPLSGYPVSILPRIRSQQIASFHDRGITDVRDIPDGELTNFAQERVRQASISGKAMLDRAHAKQLKELPYPRYFLDFEAINPTVPVWIGTRPFQQIPFQWSLHVQPGSGRLKHREFLELSGENPARPAMESLLAAAGTRGPIFVYSGFEKRMLGDMVVLLPDLAGKIAALQERLVDLLPVTRAAYYHPHMTGSWSIKAVLPTIDPSLSYDNLEGVSDGGGAQLAYEEATHHSCASSRREELRAELLKYCGLDTLGLVHLIRKLTG